MLKLKEQEFLRVYNYLKRKANILYQKSRLEQSLKHIEICSTLAYHFSFFYSDRMLEELLFANAKRIQEETTYIIQPSISGRIVFIDTNGSDNHGLTQQYIRAFIAAGIEFAYINECADLSRIQAILNELKDYSKAVVYTFDKEYPLIERTKKLLAFIQEYRPEKYFMHIMPWDVVAVMISFLLEGKAKRYNINATDHTFWLGAFCIDYCIEFRNYGYTVSIEKRGLKPQQVMMLPYYPMLNETPFLGFPKFSNPDAIKIFSGSSAYKIYGKDGMYFKMVYQILQDNPNAILLFAGAGDTRKKFKEYIDNKDIEGRIYFLGNRSDIFEVFKACDIYLGTYPICGGLMSQYAAVAGKPIAAYTESRLPVNFIEDIVCHEAKTNITYTDLDKFYAYVTSLCVNKDLRIQKGKELKECVITAEKFNEELYYLLNNNKSCREAGLEKIDYAYFSQLYLEVENDFYPTGQMIITSHLKFKTAYLFPKIFFNSAIRYLRNKIDAAK